MSWIIRSSVTPTSVPRILNGAMRVEFDVERAVDEPADGDALEEEALEVSDLQDEPVARSECDQFVRLLQRLRDRFLDQHVDAVLEAGARHLEMRAGGHRNAHGVDLAEQRSIVGQRFDA